MLITYVLLIAGSDSIGQMSNSSTFASNIVFWDWRWDWYVFLQITRQLAMHSCQISWYCCPSFFFNFHPPGTLKAVQACSQNQGHLPSYPVPIQWYCLPSVWLLTLDLYTTPFLFFCLYHFILLFPPFSNLKRLNLMRLCYCSSGFTLSLSSVCIAKNCKLFTMR